MTTISASDRDGVVLTNSDFSLGYSNLYTEINSAFARAYHPGVKRPMILTPSLAKTQFQYTIPGFNSL